MSFIQEQYRCKSCKEEFNVALGTFGYGMPEKCPKCGHTEFEWIASGWPMDAQLHVGEVCTHPKVIRLNNTLACKDCQKVMPENFFESK